MIIGVSGKARCGKTTIAHFLESELGFAHLSFAEPIRRFICSLLNVTLEELEVIKEVPQPLLGGKTPRYAMQTLGTEWGRETISDSLWVDACLSKAKLYENVVISDARFVNEAEAVIGNKGIIIQVERPGSATTTHSTHASEAGLPDNLISYTITNDSGFDSLFEKVCSIINFCKDQE